MYFYSVGLGSVTIVYVNSGDIFYFSSEEWRNSSNEKTQAGKNAGKAG